MDIILLIIWLLLLIKWADILVEWAWSIAKKYNISSLVIWLTIIAFWTSAPEFVISFSSWLKWVTDLAISNVIWSNIANIALVLWISALIYKIKIPKSSLNVEIPFLIFISFLLIILLSNIWWLNNSNELWFYSWVILSILFWIFIYYTYKISKNWIKENEEVSSIQIMPKYKSILFIVFGLIWLVYWWELIVNSAVSIAKSFWLSNAFIWVTIIAIWTSLPELASSISAALKRDTNMMIWAIVWSSIFNILWILGFSSLFINLESYSWVFIDLFIMTIIAIFLLIFWFIWKDKSLTKLKWLIFLIIYFSYIWYLIASI